MWYFQKDVKGKAYKFSLETKSAIEARSKRDEYIRLIQINGCIPDQPQPPDDFEYHLQQGLLFGAVAKQWADIKQTQVSPTTFREYRKTINKYVLPVFGNRRIDTITSLEIESFLSKIGCSGKYKQNIMTPFKNIMKFAVKHIVLLPITR